MHKTLGRCVLELSGSRNCILRISNIMREVRASDFKIEGFKQGGDSSRYGNPLHTIYHLGLPCGGLPDYSPDMLSIYVKF